jgi:DNA-3-methyladenine glycosylase II
MDFSTAIAFLQQSDPILATAIERVGPCRLVPDEGDLLFCLAETIIYQQISGKAAASIHRRFLDLYADKPLLSALDILNTPDEVLRQAGISRSKIAYLKDLAQRVLDGLPALEILQDMDDETIIRTLTQIKGIGRWSVQILLIFRLNRWDVLPSDDLGVRSAIQKLYGLETLPTQKMVEQFGQKWKPYRSIASWYLWRSLDGAGKSKPKEDQKVEGRRGRL